MKKKFYEYLIFLLIVIAISPLLIEIIDKSIYGFMKEFGKFKFDFNYLNCINLLLQQQIRKIFFIAIIALFTGFYLLAGLKSNPTINNSLTKEIAKGIFTPVAVGNGQHGTAKLMKDTELKEIFEEFIYDGSNEKKIHKNAGIIVSYKKQGKKELIKYLSQPMHVILLGATRSGKTRRVILTSTWLDLMAGINMCITGNLCVYQ